jgi:DNA-binding PadR family transcriptional regulator
LQLFEFDGGNSNNLNSGHEDEIVRNIDASKEMEKHKIIEVLLGKQKTDKRSRQNITKIFTFIATKSEFTIPQISRNLSMSQSVVWRLVTDMEDEKFVEQKDKTPSSGRGETIIYALTTKGKAAVAYIVEKHAVFEAFNALGSEVENPFLKVCFEALSSNYTNDTMQKVLDNSIKTAASMSNQKLVSDAPLTIMGEITTWFQSLQQEDLKQLAMKNVGLMEQQNSKSVTVYLKRALENLFLARLTGQKLEKYAESLGNDSDKIHVPCDNTNCDEVIQFKEYGEILRLNSYQIYCKHCTKEKLNQ